MLSSITLQHRVKNIPAHQIVSVDSSKLTPASGRSTAAFLRIEHGYPLPQAGGQVPNGIFLPTPANRAYTMLVFGQRDLPTTFSTATTIRMCLSSSLIVIETQQAGLLFGYSMLTPQASGFGYARRAARPVYRQPSVNARPAIILYGYPSFQSHLPSHLAFPPSALRAGLLYSMLYCNSDDRKTGLG